MSTYLLALVVSKLSRTYVSREESGFFPLTVYYRKDLENYTKTPLEYGGALIDVHAKFTGITYDELGDSKMEFVALPVSYGGMENWGLILFQ